MTRWHASLVVVLVGCASSNETTPAWQTTGTARQSTYRTHTPSPPEIAARNESECAAGDASACHAAALDHYYAPSPENDAIALARFRTACDAGYAASCNGVGTMYAQGRGVAEDDVEAVRWYRLACGKDGSTGCQHLADAYEDGRGVPKDLAAAERARVRGRCLFEQSLHSADAGIGSCPPAP
jgi:TPR repeat protein